jgi:hypothetical protein
MLRYLKGTIYIAIYFRGSNLSDDNIKLLGYIDANFVGYKDTYKSTYSYLFFFVEGVIIA